MALEEPAGLMPCDLCGSYDAAKLPQAERFGSGGVYVCMGCGFVHVKVRRSAEEIAASWDQLYGEGYTAAWPAVFARLNYVAEWYDQAYGWAGKSVLEIGAGEGRFLEMIRDRGAHVVGLDPSAVNCQNLRKKGIAAHHGTAEQCGTVGTFDVVVLLWTLENTQDCIRILQIARDNLREGGHVVVATGSRILVPFKKPLSRYFSKNPADLHCFRFSQRSLESAAIKAGLKPLIVNDMWQSDWMVQVASKAEHSGLTPPDNWCEVMQHFSDWERLFP